MSRNLTTTHEYATWYLSWSLSSPYGGTRIFNNAHALANPIHVSRVAEHILSDFHYDSTTGEFSTRANLSKVEFQPSIC